MRVGFQFARYAGMAALCLGALSPAYADSTQTHPQPHKKTKKQEKPPLPPLPNGPTGQKLQPLPLDSLSPVLPQVSYENGQLTIVAPNSTLGDILRAVRKQTGAEIEIPTASDRVVTHLGPGPARDVVAELLNGSRFNYVLLGSPDDPSALTRVVLVAKTDTPAPQPGQKPQPTPPPNMAPPPEDLQEMNDADQAEENAEENTEQQPPQPPADQQQGDQSVKTPQQMLQEMQQRQLQQQGQPGQPGQPFPGRPPVQPPDQQQQQPNN